MTAPDPSPWQPGTPTPDTQDAIRARQRGRAIVMGVLLGALVVLIFFISLARIKASLR